MVYLYGMCVFGCTYTENKQTKTHKLKHTHTHTHKHKHTQYTYSINKMRKGTLLINVSRGGLVDTDAVLAGLRNGQIGGLAMDVYEHEGVLVDHG